GQDISLVRDQRGQGLGFADVFQDDLADDSQRHGQDHADDPPQPRPERQRQQHDQRADAELLPRQARLDEVIDDALDDQQQQRVPGLVGVLQEAEDDRQRHGYQTADVRDEVEQEDQDAPHHGELDAEGREHDERQEPLKEADEGLEGDVIVHGAVDRLDHGHDLAGALFAEGAGDPPRQADALGDEENQIDEDDERGGQELQEVADRGPEHVADARVRTDVERHQIAHVP